MWKWGNLKTTAISSESFLSTSFEEVKSTEEEIIVEAPVSVENSSEIVEMGKHETTAISESQLSTSFEEVTSTEEEITVEVPVSVSVVTSSVYEADEEGKSKTTAINESLLSNSFEGINSTDEDKSSGEKDTIQASVDVPVPVSVVTSSISEKEEEGKGQETNASILSSSALTLDSSATLETPTTDVGRTVLIKGLQSTRGQYLNGQHATIVRMNSRGLYDVLIFDKSITLKVENVEFIDSIEEVTDDTKLSPREQESTQGDTEISPSIPIQT